MNVKFKITKKQRAFIDAEEDEVLYGGAMSERGANAGERREQRGRSHKQANDRRE